MKYRALAFVIALCLLASLILSPACTTLSREKDDKSKIHVGIVFDIGGKDDRSFNASAWQGVQRAEKDFSIVVRDVEPGNPTSIEPAMRAFAERGYDLVIGVGFAQSPIMERVARDYPNINFAIIDGVIMDDDGKTPRKNVASLVFMEHQGSYLVGMIAARATKTNKLGFIGGMEIDLIKRFAVGYKEGAHAVNPNIEVLTNYVGVTDAAWNNPGKGKELALAQISNGADVIFTAAGNSGLGAFDAVEGYGKDETGRARRFVIGVDSNQNGVKPGFVLTSMEKRVDNVVYQVIQDLVNGKFTGGFHVFGLLENGVGYSLDQYNRDLISPETLQLVNTARDKIIDCEKRRSAVPMEERKNVKCEIDVTDAMAK